ncbi:MAG: DUF6732 family protein [Pseudomonadota bacterium]
MIRLLFVVPVLISTPALAHVGHLGEAAGHDHWVAGIAIGIAIGVSIWGAIKGKKDGEEPEEEVEDPEGEEEAA